MTAMSATWSSVRRPTVALTAVVVIAAVGAVLGQHANGQAVGEPYDLAVFIAFTAVAAAGAFVAARQPRHPIGWLIVALGGGWVLAGLLVNYANAAMPALPARLAAWAASWEWVVPVGLVGLIFLVFPDGRLPSPRWRPLLWLGSGGVGLTFLVKALAPGPLPETPGLDNPFGVHAPAGVFAVLDGSAQTLFAVAMLAALASVVLRFRRADGLARRQLAWLAYAAAVVAAAFTAANVLDALDLRNVADNLRIGSLLAIPAGVAVAVLRYRLYDIDILINRTVVAAGMVGFVSTVYVALVVGVGMAVGSGTGSNLALAVVATAVVAVAFQPVQGQIQRWARRLVFGAPTPPEVRAGVSIQTLGSFQVFRDGRPVPLTAWQSKKARTLVKLLIAHRGRAVSREVLMDALWPDEDPVLATRRLSVALTTARSVLDPGKAHPPDHVLIGEKELIRIDLSHAPVDVVGFLEGAEVALSARRDAPATAVPLLRGALARYTGDFLEEDPYEDWAMPLREQARAAAIAVTRALAEVSEHSGDHDGSARYYLRLLDRDGFDEQAHLALVAILARAGRHGEARRRYAVYVDRMTEIDAPARPYPQPIDPSPNPAAASSGLSTRE